jgi:3',5'-cyclic AMP phosphodiesterase CpdA
MGDKETFASELDRLLYPYIEWFGTTSGVDNGADTRPDDEWVMVAHFPGTNLRLEDSSYTNSVRVFMDDTVLVYERTYDGRTVILRPGPWCVDLGRSVMAEQAKVAADDLQLATDRAISRAENFLPL